MKIRLEQPKDYREVENLTREAFWNIYRPGCTEHFVLNRYRENQDFIKELNFVMEEDGKIIGHVMFSKADLYDDEGKALGLEGVWTFGPISIHPDCKRKGYGLKLLKYSLEKAKQMGAKLICMEGNIDFYKHAGFVVASTLNIHYHGEPKDSDVPYFLAQELEAGFLNGLEATYHTPSGYFVADENPYAFEVSEATFPPKEKHLQENQLPQFCQSCGMPLTSDSQCGKNTDGSTNFDYCCYCYADGRFTQEMDMEGMIQYCSQFVDEFNKGSEHPITKDEYVQMMRQFFPMLKRWRK